MVVNRGFIALEQQSIFFPCKIIAPNTFFGPHHKIGVVSAFCPGERGWRIESNPLSSKGNFARFQNNQEDHVTQCRGEQRANAGSKPGVCFHQSRHRQTANDARNNSADGHTIRNDEMFEIDKCSNDQKRNKNPVRYRRLPREALPDGEEKKRCEQFHPEVTEGNFRPTICAATPKQKPA
jgi:hypothetical protein